MDIFAMVIVGVAIASVMAYVQFQKPRACSECGTDLPKFRKPANVRQTLWGGWTCPKCGSELDRQGRKIQAPQSS